MKYLHDNHQKLTGTIEFDETYVGGLEKYEHADKKLNTGRGEVGKAVVAGMKERETNKFKADVISDVKRPAPHGFIRTYVAGGSEVLTDDYNCYREW